MMSNEMITVPDGLLSYFRDEGVCQAVDLLLSKRRPPVPDNLEWSDVPNFFRSVRAARQIQVDYAILLHDVWNAAWAPLPALWYAAKPHEQVGEGLLDPALIWDQSCALRFFSMEGRDLFCELAVACDSEAGLQIGFNLTKGENSILPKRIPGWERLEQTFWSTAQLVRLGENICITPLKEYARQALEIISKCT